jgi:hypothetical protein
MLWTVLTLLLEWQLGKVILGQFNITLILHYFPNLERELLPYLGQL